MRIKLSRIWVKKKIVLKEQVIMNSGEKTLSFGIQSPRTWMGSSSSKIKLIANSCKTHRTLGLSHHIYGLRSSSWSREARERAQVKLSWARLGPSAAPRSTNPSSSLSPSTPPTSHSSSPPPTFVTSDLTSLYALHVYLSFPLHSPLVYPRP